VAAVAVLAAGTVALVLTRSGGDDEYCELLEENRDEINNFSDPPPGELDTWVSLIHDLRGSAPDEVADEWAQLDDPLLTLEETLGAAGLSWDEYVAAARSGRLDPEITEAAKRFQKEYFSADISAIGQTLSDHSQDACGLAINP
jgi:hypothetical protein